MAADPRASTRTSTPQQRVEAGRRATAMFYQAMPLCRDGELEQCWGLLERAVRLRPDSRLFVLMSAQVMQDMDRDHEAVGMLSQAIAMADADDPGDLPPPPPPDAFSDSLRLGALLGAVGRHEESLAVLRSAVAVASSADDAVNATKLAMALG